MAVPTNEIKIKALGKEKIKSIHLIGSTEIINWKQTNGILIIQKPKSIPNENALVLKIKKLSKIKL